MNDIITPTAEPSERRLSANVVFHAVAAANEPLGESVAYRVDARGFWDERSAGSAGEDALPASLDDVAASLSERFDPAELDLVLSHLAALRGRLPS